MKKLFSIALIIVLVSSLLVGCTPKADENKIEKLIVYFVPSREPDEIVTATEPLKELLKNELADRGFDIGEVEISVGTSYEAVGVALDAGTAHIGFIPAGTYVLYDDGAEVILTATRNGLNKDSGVAKDWNDGQPTEAVEEQVTYYRGLIVAGPSEKGQAILAKVNAGEELTVDDIKGLKWGVRSSTSSSGYIYPTIWLMNNFDITIPDIPEVVQTDSYGSSMARLASGQVDVVTIFADARRDYAEEWVKDYQRENTIWEETGVIGVTDGIYNDTISVTKNNEEMTPELIKALQESFISIAETEEGKNVISIYSHYGYKVAKSEDYDNERLAQEIIKSTK